MITGNSRHRLSRLEVLLSAVMMLAIVGCVFFCINQSRQQWSEQASLAGDSSTGTDARPAEFGSEDDGDHRGETGTIAALESSEFSEKSRSIVLPVTGDATNIAGGMLSDNSVDEVAGRPSMNPAAVNEEKRPPAAAGDIQAELQRIASMPWGPDTEKQLQTALAQWAETDPASALAYALNLESRRAGSAAVSKILDQWSQRDPLAAYEWFKQHLASNPQMVSDALTNIFGKMAAADSDMALRNVWELPQQGMRNRALRTIVNQMIASGVMRQLLGGGQAQDELEGNRIR